MGGGIGGAAVAGLGARLVEAYVAPRRSAARLLAAQPRRGDAAALLALGVVLGLIGQIGAEALTGRSVEQALLEGARLTAPSGAPPDLVTSAALGAMQALAFYVAAALIAFWLGRRAGGHAELDALASLSGWWSVTWAPAKFATALVLVTTPPESFGSALVFGLVAEVFMIYIFAGFVAQAHGFASTARVTAAALGVLLATVVLLLVVLGGAVPG